MDKLADKISANEMIKANAAAEAAETERLRTQVVQYQQEMEEIKKSAGELKNLIADLAGKIENDSDDKADEESKKLLELLNQNINDTNKSILDSINKRLDEEHKYTHDIGVQVYRNVQASSQDENKKLTDDIIKRILDENDHLAISVADETSGQLQRVLEGLSERQKELERKIEALSLATDKNHACMTVSVITLIAVLAGIVVNVLNILGILSF